MPKTFAYQVDDETAILIELDRKAMSDHAGVELNSSAYHRIVMQRHLQGENGNPVGIGLSEGFRAGFAKVSKALQTALHRVSKEIEQEMLNGEIPE